MGNVITINFVGFGAAFSGYLFKEIFIGHSSNNFWNNSILFLKEIEHNNLPFYLIITTPIIVIIAIPISYFYFVKNTRVLEEFKKTNTPLYNFLLNKWYIDELYDFILVNPLKKVGKFFWKEGDQNTIDKFGPDGISKIIKQISNRAVQFQSGYIYDYAFVMLIGLSALITYLIFN